MSVRSEVFTAVTMKNAVFWDVTPVYVRSVLRLLFTVNVATSWRILVTLMMEGIRSSEMSVLTSAIRCNIPEDGILHSNSDCRTSTPLPETFTMYYHNIDYALNCFIITDMLQLFHSTGAKSNSLLV
jgi:hypothetical protein